MFAGIGEIIKSIRREMKRRAAVEPVIGHVTAEHRMERNYLKGTDGNRANAILAAFGYNVSPPTDGSRLIYGP